jgi:hypothetical protein
MSRGNADAAIDAGRRMLEQAVDAGIRRAQGVNAKLTLKRYSWSRLHTDLLDDFRWSLVAKRANAPLPLVEAVLIRLENHANRSRPRGHVGDFSAEGVAARWNVEADLIGRIFAELEAPDIGWIDQDQIVSFWDRNPDIVDDTAADRQQRARDRKKGMKQLAAMARQGFITEQQRLERELALKDSREPKLLMAAWAGLSTDASRRDSVTVTTRAEQTINQDVVGREESGLAGQAVGADFFPDDGVNIVGFGQAQLWLETEGLKLVTARLQSLATRSRLLIERWTAGVDGDLAALVPIILGAVGTSAIGEAFATVIENQIGRRRQEQEGPRLPLPPVGLVRKSG